MGEKKFTLFELHIDGETQVGPSALPEAILGGRIEGETTTEDEVDETAGAADDGGRGAIAVVVGLIALVAIAVAVRKFRADEEEPIARPEEQDVVVS